MKDYEKRAYDWCADMEDDRSSSTCCHLAAARRLLLDAMQVLDDASETGTVEGVAPDYQNTIDELYGVCDEAQADCYRVADDIIQWLAAMEDEYV